MLRKLKSAGNRAFDRFVAARMAQANQTIERLKRDKRENW